MENNFMRLHGARMADNGYAIVPLAAGQKWPGEFENGRWWPRKGWEIIAQTGTPEPLIDIWANYPGCGVGIVCGGKTGVIGVDIDVLDAEIAGAVRQSIEGMLGVTPLVRVGKAPKVLLVYRTTEPMEKLSYQPIEVLATGQQFVAYGVHPDTGLPYSWPEENPTDTPLDAIPLVTPAQVEAAVRVAFELIPEEMRAKRFQDSGQDKGQHVPSGDTARAMPEAIREALAHIPNPDVSWDDWKRVLMATFAASHGDEDAYFDFLDWSRKSRKNNDTVTRKEWTSCRASPPRSLGFGTLHYLATQHGWVPSAGLVFNTSKDVSDVDISGFDAMPFAEVPIKQPTDQLQQISEVTEATFGLDETALPPGAQEQAQHGALPKEFVDQFPQEWLFTSSLIGQMATWIESASPISHRVFALMAAFTAFGAIVGRQYRTESGIRPNIACIIVAGTGSGKEGPRNAVSRLLMAAEADRYIGPRGGFSSGSGVVQGLLDRPNMWLAVDEFGKKIAAYGGRADQNQREMIALFLEALVNDYVGGKGYANSAENPTKNIVLPNLNIYGSSQIGEITGALSSAATADGLIQRFLFVPTFTEYVPIKPGFVKPAVPQVLIESIKWLKNHLANMGGEFAINDDPAMEPNQCIVVMTQGAQDLFMRLDQRRVEMARAGRVMWVRSAVMAAKIAMLEAIARDPISPTIDAELLNSSRMLVDWFTLYAETVLLERIADNYEESCHKKVLHLINSAGSNGITHSDLLRQTQFMDAKRVNEIIKRFVDSDQITVEAVKPARGPERRIYRIRPK